MLLVNYEKTVEYYIEHVLEKSRVEEIYKRLGVKNLNEFKGNYKDLINDVVYSLHDIPFVIYKAL